MSLPSISVAPRTRPPHSEPFFARQFSHVATGEQRLFDVIFAIIAPILCVACDPVVFKGERFGRPIFQAWSAGAYCAIAIGLIALTIWLTTRRPAALLSGLLSAGALFAMGVGIVLLPVSVLGLYVLIGVLGFTPLLTAFSFWRNAVRAYRVACVDIDRGRMRRIQLQWAAGMIVGLALPVSSNIFVGERTAYAAELVLSDDPQLRAEGIWQLKSLRLVADLDPIVYAYGTTQDQDRRRQIAESYQEITGTDIERRWNILND
jgi:hypothetical protein